MFFFKKIHVRSCCNRFTRSNRFAKVQLKSSSHVVMTAADVGYRCHRCGRQFENHLQLGGHLSAPRCRPLNWISVPVLPPAVAPATSKRGVCEARTPIVCAEFSDAYDDDAISLEEMHQLLQRPCKDDADHLVRPANVQRGSLARASNARKTYKLYQVCAHI